MPPTTHTAPRDGQRAAACPAPPGRPADSRPRPAWSGLSAQRTSVRHRRDQGADPPPVRSGKAPPIQLISSQAEPIRKAVVIATPSHVRWSRPAREYCSDHQIHRVAAASRTMTARIVIARASVRPPVRLKPGHPDGRAQTPRQAAHSVRLKPVLRRRLQHSGARGCFRQGGLCRHISVRSLVVQPSFLLFALRSRSFERGAHSASGSSAMAALGLGD